MHRFFLLGQSLTVAQSVDLTPLAHQLIMVLRVQPGAQIMLLDGQGAAFLTEVRSVERRRVIGQILTQQSVSGEPRLELTLFQCSLKADKFEWVLQKGAELGVKRFAPVISERSIVRPASALRGKYERWRTILAEAAEQSGRGCIPTLVEPLLWEQAVHTAQGLRLLPWEQCTRATPSLSELIVTVGSPTPAQVSLLIGPEGGVTAGEANLAVAAGWKLASLGPRVLRAETAALAGISVIMDRCGELTGL